jgi:hypothetical protein
MDELLERLQALTPEEGDGFTSTDVAELMGVGSNPARSMIKQLIKSGQAEPHRFTRRNMAGVMQRVFGYRLVKEESPPV